MASNDTIGFTLEAARRIARTVREVDRLVQYRPRHQAAFPVPTETPIIVARIIGGSNPYSAVEVVPGEGGTWTAKTDGIAWTVSDNPLYERNDNADVPADTIVLVWKAFVADDLSSREWVFDHCCTNQLSVNDTTISSDQNNYVLPTTNILNVNATSNFSFTGFTFSGGAPAAGRTIEIANTGTNTITLPHESGSSSSANQVSTPTGASWEIPPKASVKLKYLGGKWMIADVPKIPAAHTSGSGGATKTTYSGTTTDALATVFSLSNSSGLWFKYEVENTGANALTIQLTATSDRGKIDSGGELVAPGGILLKDGNFYQGVTVSAVVEVQSYSPGMATTYAISVTRLA